MYFSVSTHLNQIVGITGNIGSVYLYAVIAFYLLSLIYIFETLLEIEKSRRGTRRKVYLFKCRNKNDCLSANPTVDKSMKDIVRKIFQQL